MTTTVATVLDQQASSQPELATPDTTWFDAARFGLFIHWGVYAVPTDRTAEWFIFRKAVPRDRYRRYADRFRADRFEPKAWADQAAAAGCKYVVFTAKHHDGFCLYDSGQTDWKITNTPLGRDVFGEVADAVRNAGLRFGCYFSIWDLWHTGLDGGVQAIDAEGNPAAFNSGLDNRMWAPTENGVAYMHAQLDELMTGYGRIDMLWFDVRRAAAEAYDGPRLIENIRKRQPGILVNDRLVLGQRGPLDPRLTPDIVTPENKVPTTGLTKQDGDPQRWESCMCLNEHWGYCRDDRAYRTAAQVLAQLADIASKGGNLLLNVGPNARGEFPAPWYPETLNAVGRWLERNGQSIYSTTPCRITSDGQPFHPWFTDSFKWRVAYTQRDQTLYAHVLKPSVDGLLSLPKLDGHRVAYIEHLDDASELPFESGSYLTRNPGEWTITLPKHAAEDCANGEPTLTTLAIHLEPETQS